MAKTKKKPIIPAPIYGNKAFIRAPYLRDELRMGMISETFETCTTWQNFPRIGCCGACGDSTSFAQHTSGKALLLAVLRTFILMALRLITPSLHLLPKASSSRSGTPLKPPLLQALIAWGATITHHHAVGKDHRPYYLQQNSALTLTMLKAAEKASIPKALNPGTLL